METTAQNESFDAKTTEAKQAAARITSAAHSTVDKIAGAAVPAVDRLASTAHATVDKIAGAASSAADVLGEQGGRLKATQERVFDSCSAYVQENPLMSLGIAVLTGYLLSRLIDAR